VIREIEAVIATYPAHSDQQAFLNPMRRQRLIAYVLSRIPGHYAVIDDAVVSDGAGDAGIPAIDTTHLYTSTGEKLQISSLIHHGIELILQEDSDRLKHCSPDASPETSARCGASSWFG
jgi:hypothetical protein